MKRNKIDIIADILTVAKEETLRTPILYGASLNFNQLREYIPYLLEVNLLNSVDCSEHKFYKTTKKGFSFLEKYQEIRSLLCIHENEPNILRRAYGLQL